MEAVLEDGSEVSINMILTERQSGSRAADSTNSSVAVDFMIIGAMKSGTTSLAHHLSLHPQVAFCAYKEPHFFSKTKEWRKEVDRYHRLYKPKAGQKLGEASVSYTMRHRYPDTCDRIYDYSPSMRLIYLMRDPVERMVSHYAHRRVRKRRQREPAAEVAADPSYVNCSKYFYQISPYLDRFDRKHVLLLTFEALVQSPLDTLTRIAKLIGIDETYFGSVEHTECKNSSTDRLVLPDYKLPYSGHLKKWGIRYLPESVKELGLRTFGSKLHEKVAFSEELKSRLYAQVESDVRHIERLMGRQMSEWKHY